MKIYLDLLIIQDTIITSMILFLLSKLLKIKINYLKIIMVALLSSILTTCILIFNPKLYDNLLVKICFSFIISMLFKTKDTLPSKITMLWLITFLFGGIGFASEGNVFLMLLLIPISIFIILKRKRIKEKQLLLDSATCFIEFKFNNKIYNLKALVDTGHHVTSLYGEDVIFIKENLFNEEGGDNRHNRTVSYQTVSGEQKKVGIKIFNIKVSYGNKKICNNAVIVRTPNILNNYDAIIGYRLIEGGWTDGNFDFDETKSQEIVY